MSPSTETRENREFAAETKFMVTPAIAEQIQQWAQQQLSPDPHGSGDAGDAYRITSIYFDTDQFSVFHRQGSFGRSKYRIRRYGSSAVAFLERKLKTRGLVTKRRSVVSLEELKHLNGAGSLEGWIGRWFHRRLGARRLNPVCQISYDRTARVAMTPAGIIRLTLDHNIRASDHQALHFRDREETALLSKDEIIVEMKYRYELPVLFKRLIEEFKLTPTAVSKYRLAAAKLGLVEEVQPTAPAPVSESQADICLSGGAPFSLGASPAA
jgi:hypothetical protein